MDDFLGYGKYFCLSIKIRQSRELSNIKFKGTAVDKQRLCKNKIFIYIQK